MVRFQPKERLVVPDHREVRLGTLQQILQDSGLSIEEFIGLL